MGAVQSSREDLGAGPAVFQRHEFRDSSTSGQDPLLKIPATQTAAAWLRVEGRWLCLEELLLLPATRDKTFLEIVTRKVRIYIRTSVQVGGTPWALV